MIGGKKKKLENRAIKSYAWTNIERKKYIKDTNQLNKAPSLKIIS